jgi:hypothetical protein
MYSCSSKDTCGRDTHHCHLCQSHYDFLPSRRRHGGEEEGWVFSEECVFQANRSAKMPFKRCLIITIPGDMVDRKLGSNVAGSSSWLQHIQLARTHEESMISSIVSRSSVMELESGVYDGKERLQV